MDRRSKWAVAAAVAIIAAAITTVVVVKWGSDSNRRRRHRPARERPAPPPETLSHGAEVAADQSARQVPPPPPVKTVEGIRPPPPVVKPPPPAVPPKLPDEPAKLPATQAKPAPPASTPRVLPIPRPPALMSASEASAAFPAGDLRRSKKLNGQGYRARKRGDHSAAVALYRQAVTAAPAYGQARLNLACELALAGRADAALAELSMLYRSGRPDHRKYLRLATADSDLASLWKTGRFMALISGVAPNSPVTPAKLKGGGCHGYTPASGAVVCGYHISTSEWPAKAGGVLFGGTTQKFAVPMSDEEWEEDETRELQAALRQAGVAGVRLPRFALTRNRERALGNAGLRARWAVDSDGLHTLTVTGPAGRATLLMDADDFQWAEDPVSLGEPSDVRVWLVPGWSDRVVAEANYEVSDSEMGDESWNAVALVRLEP